MPLKPLEGVLTEYMRLYDAEQRRAAVAAQVGASLGPQLQATVSQFVVRGRVYGAADADPCAVGWCWQWPLGFRLSRTPRLTTRVPLCLRST